MSVHSRNLFNEISCICTLILESGASVWHSDLVGLDQLGDEPHHLRLLQQGVQEVDR